MTRAWLVPVLVLLGAAPSPEERLQAAWRAQHPGQAAPASCGEGDVARTVALDGKLVAASLRWGLVVFDGDRVAAWKSLGCDPQYGGAVVSLEAVEARPGHVDLAVRARRSGHCGTVTDWTLFDGSLTPLFTVDEQVDRACGAAPEEHRRAPVTVSPGLVRAGDHAFRWDGRRFTDSAADRRTR